MVVDDCLKESRSKIIYRSKLIRLSQCFISKETLCSQKDYQEKTDLTSSLHPEDAINYFKSVEKFQPKKIYA